MISSGNTIISLSLSFFLSFFLSKYSKLCYVMLCNITTRQPNRRFDHGI